MKNLSNAYKIFRSKPKSFIASMLFFLIISIVVTMATIGLAAGYFLILAFANMTELVTSPLTLIVAALLAIFYKFIFGGLYASLLRSYHLYQRGVSLTEFYTYAFDRAPTIFLINLTKLVVWAIFSAPLGLFYIYYLNQYELSEIIISMAALLVGILVEWFFYPSIIWASVFGGSFKSSLRRIIPTLKQINYTGYYLLYLVSFVLYLIPLINLTYFLIHPILSLVFIRLVSGERR